MGGGVAYSIHGALREESITLKELVPVVLVGAVWGRQWSDCMHCDNEGAVAAITSGYSRVAPIMHLLRCLFFIRARRGVAVKAVHIPGRLNTVADAISRDNLATYSGGQEQASPNLARSVEPAGGGAARLDVPTVGKVVRELHAVTLRTDLIIAVQVLS